MIPVAFTDGIDSLCIDASSMIYQLRIGLLGSLAAETELISIPSVIEETGWPHLPVESQVIDRDGLSNDDALLELARSRGVPLLSEDRELLLKAGNLGMAYYNSLMMINYLLFRGRIEMEEYPRYLEKLKDYARYSKQVLDYGETLYRDIIIYKSQRE